MAVDLDTGILAPLLVVFVGAAAVASGKVYLLGKEKKTLTGKLADLDKKLVASENHRKEHLNVAMDNYREEIERQKKQFEEAKMSHEEVREFAAFLLQFIERKHPGWLERRLKGEPEYEFVFTDPKPKGVAAVIKRPPPPPRSTKDAARPE